jgi:hypothetical protein
LATAQAHVTASDSSASVGLLVADVITAVMRWPAVNVFAAVALVVAGVALLTATALNPVTLVPLYGTS